MKNGAADRAQVLTEGALWVRSARFKNEATKRILTRERRAPIRQTIVTSFDPWIGASMLKTSLWLVAHYHHELSTFARFRTQRLRVV
jgi:hypothetical protein